MSFGVVHYRAGVRGSRGGGGVGRGWRGFGRGMDEWRIEPRWLRLCKAGLIPLIPTSHFPKLVLVIALNPKPLMLTEN